MRCQGDAVALLGVDEVVVVVVAVRVIEPIPTEW
jgi:hypothetical protein